METVLGSSGMKLKQLKKTSTPTRGLCPHTTHINHKTAMKIDKNG